MRYRFLLLFLKRVTRLPFFVTPAECQKRAGPAGLLRSCDLRGFVTFGQHPYQAAQGRLKTFLPLPYGWRCQSGFEERREPEKST